jgi:Trypsin-co-occurring domain 1
MSTRVESLRFGGAEVLVATVQLPGTERTGTGIDKVRDKAVDALEAARDTIESVALSAQRTIADLKAKAACPATVEVEIGLAFSVQGNVIIAGGGVEASVTVHLTYDTSQP